MDTDAEEGSPTKINPNLKEIDGRVDTETLCKLCFQPAQLPYVNDEGCDPDDVHDFVLPGKMRLGPLYQLLVDDEIYCAHYFCLLFSSGLDQNGEDHEGIQGFMPQDILKEWRRGQRLKCYYCKKSYPTVGCTSKSCRRSYHVPCAIKNGCLLQFCDEYPSTCHEHRLEQNHPTINGNEEPCGICLKEVGEDVKSRLWVPCCNGWFHFGCLDRMAQSAGYFFKCPLCNNKTEFESEVKRFGIHVPEKDASWELEQDAFDSLLTRHGMCDADECHCPLGRSHDVDYTEWEVILCSCCGGQGTHMGCMKLKPVGGESKWKCSFCSKVVQKLPPTVQNVYYPVNKRSKKNNKKIEDKTMSQLLRGQKFLVQDGQLKAVMGDGKIIETSLQNQ